MIIFALWFTIGGGNIPRNGGLELAIRVGAHFILNKWLPGFSNISDPENPRFWMYQNIKRIDRFRKRTGGYLTNSNSPTTKVQRIRDRLLKPVASTLIIIYEVDSHISNPWFHAQPTHVVQGCATKHSICGVVYFQNFHALFQSLGPTFLYSNPISPILVFRIIAAIDHYLTHGTV
jgi:hypothetical protein